MRTNSWAPGYETNLSRRLRQAWRQVARLRFELANSLRRRRGVETGGIGPRNVVWIFGTGRTGSTWLAAMMGEVDGHTVWFEPRVGDLFDPQRFERYKGEHFILSVSHKKTWLKSMRTFVLDGANARFPEAAGEGWLVIKEPGGSGGAQLLMEALPESCMILLVRDPRDVVASWMDASREGGWQNERRKSGDRRQVSSSDEAPEMFVRRHSNAYLRHVGNAKRAYDSHTGHKVVIRYEELRTNALGTMKRLYTTLGIPVDEEEISKAVEKHSWEKIPKEKKGPGKFYRKATPKGWRGDLTPRQVEIVEEVTAPLLKEFYSA